MGCIIEDSVGMKSIGGNRGIGTTELTRAGKNVLLAAT